MHIAFASAHPYLPQIAGGSQSNTHEMAREMLARGHRVSVLAGLTKAGWIGARARVLMKLSKEQVVRDESQGYPVYRAWHSWDGAARMAARARPDVVIVQSGQMVRVAEAIRAAGVPTILYLHNIEFDDHGADIASFKDHVFLANSDFTAQAYRKAYGIDATVITPLFQPERYRVESSRERVLFINPHPLKGVDLALDVAAGCPDIPFDFVESWTLSSEQRTALDRRLSTLPNVTLHGRTDDMRAFYGRARLVLIPSRWEETWGRVASEAHYSGLPVIATNVGGLVEAVGPGGLLLDRAAGATEWIEALRSLWSDAAAYSRMSDAASAYSARPSLQSRQQLDELERAIERALGARAIGSIADPSRQVR